MILLAGGPKFFIKDNSIYTDCDGLYPDLFFLIEEVWLQVLPQDYVIDMSDFGDRSLCQLMLKENKEESFVLGIPLLQGYCVNHNMDTSTIGFAPSLFSSKTDVQLA